MGKASDLNGVEPEINPQLSSPSSIALRRKTDPVKKTKDPCKGKIDTIKGKASDLNGVEAEIKPQL